MGCVADFVFDSESWKILYLRVDTGRWACPRKLLVPHQWVASVSWQDRGIMFSLLGATGKNAPSFESLSGVTAEVERGIGAYYEGAAGTHRMPNMGDVKTEERS